MGISVVRIRKYERGEDAIPDNVKRAIYKVWENDLLSGDIADEKKEEKEMKTFQDMVDEASNARLKMYYETLHKKIMSKL